MLGRYKLIEKLGECGFGAVWLAEHKEPVRRKVAFRIIKLGMDTKQVGARFEAKRQVRRSFVSQGAAYPHENRSPAASALRNRGNGITHRGPSFGSMVPV